MATTSSRRAAASGPSAPRAPARIVPAIPLALTRKPASARPISPEDPPRDAVPQHVTSPLSPAAEEKVLPHQSGTAQSKESETGKPELQTPTSPAGSHDAPLQSQNVGAVETSPNGQPPRHEEESGVEQPHANQDESAPADLREPVESSDGSAPQALTDFPNGAPTPVADASSAQTDAVVSSEARSPTVHNHQGSLDGIVFGTAPKSPALPPAHREAESEGHGRPSQVPRLPPGFAPPQFAAPFYPGHAHHPSHPQAAFGPLLGSMPIMDPNRVAHTAPDLPPLAFSGQPPYQTSASSQHASIAVNGVSGAHTVSPIKSQSSDHDEEQFAAHVQNGSNGMYPPVAKTTPPTLKSTEFTDVFELAHYMSSQVGNPEFADFELRVVSEDSILFHMPVHGIIVSRSRAIASAIRRLPAQHYDAAPRVITIFTQDRFVTPDALTEAVKILYGVPLLHTERFVSGLGPFRPEGEQSPMFAETRRRMDQAISYAAAGKLFQIPSMHDRGVDIMKSMLRWDTIDQAVEFALNSHPYTHSGQPSDEAYFARKFLEHDVADFVAFNFPPNFRFYAISPELKRAPRLPVIPERSVHNPRLSRIRFGDVPPEEELKPNYAFRVLSSILLSVPLPLLNHVLNHPAAVRSHWEGMQAIIHDVIEERERRRQKVAKNGAGLPDGVSNVLAENILWAEYSSPSTEHASGLVLTEARDVNYA